MSTLSDYGLTVKAMRPNAEGMCIYRILDADGREIGRTDACTAEDALRAINAWVAELPAHMLAPDAPVKSDAPKKEIDLGVWNWFGS